MSTCFPVLFKEIHPCVIPCDTLGTNQLLIEENLVIPSVKPEVEQINEVKTEVKIDEQSLVLIIDKRCRQISFKVLLSGLIKEKIIYTAALEDQPVHVAHFTNPFCGFVLLDFELPLKEEYLCLESRLKQLSKGLHIEICVEGVIIRKIDGKNFFKCLILLVSVIGDLDEIIAKVKN